MEKGFEDMNTKFGDMDTKFGGMNTSMNTGFAELEKKIESVKSDFKLTKWEIHLIFGGVIAVSTI